jgi:hypothetical protein
VSRTRLSVPLLCFVALGAISCRRPDATSQSSLTSDEEVLRYGHAPAPNANVTYQPDVTIVEGGPRVIRSASADSLVWVIDGKARGAEQLAVGRIMFVVMRAVGRVAAIERRGGDLAVTLAPVGLTEIFRNAEIRLDREFTPDEVVYQEVPDLPGMLSTPESTDLASGEWTPPPYLVFTGAGALFGDSVFGVVAAAEPDVLPRPRKASFKVAVGDWEVEPSYKEGKNRENYSLGLKVQRRLLSTRFGAPPGEEGPHSGALKAGVEATLFFKKMHVRTSATIRDGKVAPGMTFLVDGIDEVDISIWAGVQKGFDGAQKARVEVPIEMNFPGTPPDFLAAQIRFKFLIEVALAGTSALKAVGRYAVLGSFGLLSGEPVAPTFAVKEPIMKNVSGVTMGGAGIVWAWETRFQVGAGVAVAMAGPYTKFTWAIGLARGSILGVPLSYFPVQKTDGKSRG